MSDRSSVGVNSDEVKGEQELKLASSEWIRGTTEKHNCILPCGDVGINYPQRHAESMEKSRAIGADSMHNS